MNDALVMSMLHGQTHRDEQIHPIFHGQVILVTKVRDWNSLDQFHDEVRSATVRCTGIQNTSDIGMIHQRQSLSFAFEASDHFFGIHTWLDDLQRHFAPDRFRLLGHVDNAKSPFANSLQELVGADNGPGILGNLRPHVADTANRRAAEKIPRFCMSLQQSLQPFAKCIIAAATLPDEPQPLFTGFQIQRFQKDFLLIHGVVPEFPGNEGDDVTGNGGLETTIVQCEKPTYIAQEFCRIRVCQRQTLSQKPDSGPKETKKTTLLNRSEGTFFVSILRK